mgnify:CR=1 FL=1
MTVPPCNGALKPTRTRAVLQARSLASSRVRKVMESDSNIKAGDYTDPKQTVADDPDECGFSNLHGDLVVPHPFCIA